MRGRRNIYPTVKIRRREYNSCNIAIYKGIVGHSIEGIRTFRGLDALHRQSGRDRYWISAETFNGWVLRVEATHVAELPPSPGPLRKFRSPSHQSSKYSSTSLLFSKDYFIFSQLSSSPSLSRSLVSHRSLNLFSFILTPQNIFK